MCDTFFHIVSMINYTYQNNAIVFMEQDHKDSLNNGDTSLVDFMEQLRVLDECYSGIT